MNKRLHAYYSGSVQGVGFRYTALHTAVSLNLTGWVKNLKCGRVEIMCEGKEADLEAFAQKIDDILGRYVRDKDVDWSEATNEFEGFDIRF